MGRKVNPKGFRLGKIFSWDSHWFAEGLEYKDFVIEDAKIRQFLFKKLQLAGVTQIEIERSVNKINIIIHVVRPGMVIGRGGQGIEELKKLIENVIYTHKKEIGKLDRKKPLKLELRVEPVKNPYLNAYFLATQIAEQLAKRLTHKRVVFYAMEKVMIAGAKGVKVILSGRIAGAEISRKETYKRGAMPLSTIRAEIDFAAVPSLTKSGYIGVKVWICR